MSVVKMNEREAKWVNLLYATGLTKTEISQRYGFKYMDVVNVLRGNAFSSVTGILNRNIKPDELVVAQYLLKQSKPYREIAVFTGIDANKIRNIRGVLQFKGVIS